MRQLLGRTTLELEEIARSHGLPAYRGRQIARWLYRRGSALEAMTDLPAATRTALAGEFESGLRTVAHREVAADGTTKYLVRAADGELVECVHLPYADRVSVCLSSQVGCAAGCTFCATALGGFSRNLTAGEIAGQFVAMQADRPDRRVSHAVYMGMGEPLLNYDNVLASVRLLTEEIGLSARGVTLSTVGVVPGILRLAGEAIPLTLALSLHAPDDALRERLVPTARKWKLDQILAACGEYHARTGRNLTFEYLLLADVNDRPEQARALADRIQGLPGNVNLIPFNHVETPAGFRRPAPERVRAFREALAGAGRPTTQRMERGHAVSAACGQLRRAALPRIAPRATPGSR